MEIGISPPDKPAREKSVNAAKADDKLLDLMLPEPPSPDNIRPSRKGFLSKVIGSSDKEEEIAQLRMIERELEDMRIQADVKAKELDRREKDLERSAKLIADAKKELDEMIMKVVDRLDTFEEKWYINHKKLSEEVLFLKESKQHISDAIKELKSDKKALDSTEDEVTELVKLLEKDKKALDKREDEIVKVVGQLEKDKAVLEKDENSIVAKIDILEAKKKELDKKEKALFELDTELKKKEGILSQRESSLWQKRKEVEQLKRSISSDRQRLAGEESSVVTKIKALERDQNLFGRRKSEMDRSSQRLERLEKKASELRIDDEKVYESVKPKASKYVEKEVAKAINKAQAEKKPDVEKLKGLIAYAKKQAMVKQFIAANVTYKEANNVLNKLNIKKEERESLHLDMDEIYNEIQLGLLGG